MKIEDLISLYQDHIKELVKNRVENNQKGYTWTYKGINYDKELELKEFQDFFDRKELNKEHNLRAKETNTSLKKPSAWIQTEINLIYSFHKCFALRNRTRLQSYRDDLSQKGVRTRASLNNSIGKFLSYRNLAEQ
jgi:hypothetical protein